jgi:hypothetical protein
MEKKVNENYIEDRYYHEKGKIFFLIFTVKKI